MKTGAQYGLLGLIALLVAVFASAPQFTGPPPVNAASDFNTDRAFERLERILGDERPHPVDTGANDALRERLLTEIEALGFEPVVRDDFQCWNKWGAVCARVRNVLFWATEPGPDAVMLASHYDSVPAGPGAADDGAGVAASLEIAAILSQRELSRPLLVLITDGEEAGLIGARSFVEKDPLASQVGAVVNMEARGVTGEAMLFQTGRPNERDIAALARSGGRLPSASSLDADIYELLPNDTDMTLFLTLGVDAANFAFARGARFYHTPEDKLANLDRRSLYHIGQSALDTAETFLKQGDQGAERQLIYADLLGRWFVSAPQGWGAALLGIGALLSLALFAGARSGAPIRSAAAPLLALVAGLALAVATAYLAAAIRPETSFGASHPWALRTAYLFAALLGAAAVYSYVAPSRSQMRLLASAWFWFALLGAAAFAVAPGAAILFAPSLLFFSIAMGAQLAGANLAARAAALLGALIFAILVLPLAARGEASLFVENAAPFALLPLLTFIFMAPLCTPAEGMPWRAKLLTVAAPAIMLAASFICVLTVPAYSPAVPRHLSITHISGAGENGAYWALPADETPPENMTALAPFTLGEAEGMPGKRYLAPAPVFATQGATAELTRDRVAEGARRLRFAVSAPEADAVWMPLPEGAAIKSMKINGNDVGDGAFFCAGRACRELDVEFSIGADAPPPPLYLWSLQYGLGPESDALRRARPDWAVPMQMGDMRAFAVKLPL